MPDVTTSLFLVQQRSDATLEPLFLDGSFSVETGKTGSKLGIGIKQAQELFCLKRHIKGLVEVSLSS